MKDLTKKIIIGSLIGLPVISKAQFLLPFPFNYGVTQPSVQKIGIGNFPTNASVQAKLHINEFLLANDPATNGLMFRTDGNNNTDNSWSIYTGVNTNSLTEKFRLYVPANSTNAVLQTQQPNSRILFNTNGAINRMLITGGGTGSGAGRIAMGNNLPANFIPQDRLHLHQNIQGPYIRFTNNNTSPAANSGFRVGINNTGVAMLQNLENKPMKFFTNNIQRMHINDDNGTTNGFIGIGNGFSSPLSLLHINGIPNNTGEVFRTDAPNGVSTYWRLLSGGQNIGNIYTDNNIDFKIEASRTTGKLLLYSGGPTPGSVSERVRITQSPGFEPGVTNVSRVGINHDLTPIGVPVAMLHIGNSANIANATRPWMDVGTFYNLQSDHMYVGLKNEDIISGDRMDAVINWGNNYINTPTGHGPDNLRFIFNAAFQPFSSDPRESQDGLELARMIPELATTLTAPNYGMMGIGNFSPTGPNPPGSPSYIDAKLDIDGDLRIRQVNQKDSLTRILAIDPNDFNRVYWVDASSLGGSNVMANNGLSIDPNNPNNVQFGQDVGAPGNPAMLLNDREIPMNKFNIRFTGLGTAGGNLISVGAPNTLFPGIKFYTHNDTEPFAIGGYTDGTQIPYSNRIAGVGGYVDNAASDLATGVYGRATNTQFGLPGRGVMGEARINTYNYGVHGRAIALGQGTLNWQNIGGYFEAGNATNATYGIYATASSNTGTVYAGFFDGDVWISGNGFVSGGTAITSDQMFKTNIDSIENALSIIRQLKPKEFYFDTTNTYNLKFSEKKQYGLIAQDVELVLPELVTSITKPEQYDSLGNIIAQSITFKSLNYNAFIAILIKGMQEQDRLIDSMQKLIAGKDSLYYNLLQRLTEVENCLSNTGICNGHNGNGNHKISPTQFIELSNANSIILDQNVPNPFAENTTITFNIPEDVQSAKLVFYDLNGRILKEVEILERGAGSLMVYGENLKSGIYTYTLLADGKVIATKKMVKSE